MTVVVTGAKGYVGRAFSQFIQTKQDSIPLTLRPDSFSDVSLIPSSSVIVHLGALSSPAQSALSPRDGWLSNTILVEHLITYAALKNCFFVFASTDWVFDGAGDPPSGGFLESDLPYARSPYGRSKLEAENSIKKLLPPSSFAIVRFSLIYSVSSVVGGIAFIQSALETKKQVTLFSNEWRTPIHLTDAVKILAEVSLNRKSGIFHAAGPQRISRSEMGVFLAQRLSADPRLIIKKERSIDERRRPRDLSLSNRVVCQELGVSPYSFEEVMRRKCE